MTSGFGTRNYGIAVVQNTMSHVKGLMYSIFQVNEQSIKAGLGASALSLQELYEHVLCNAQLKDKKNANLIEVLGGTKLVQKLLDQMIDEGSVTENSDGTYSPTWSCGEAPLALRPFNVDGVQYPFVVKFSPSEIHFYAQNPDKFSKKYPQGDWNKLRLGSMHLKKGIISAFQEGGWYCLHRNLTSKK